MLKALFDPVDAFFEGITSSWLRIPFYFLFGIAGHAIGLALADFDPEKFSWALIDWQSLPSILPALPVSFFGHIALGFLYVPGWFYIAFMVVTFCLAAFTEISLSRLLPLVFLVEMWATCLMVREFLDHPSAWGPILCLIITVCAVLLAVLVFLTNKMMAKRRERGYHRVPNDGCPLFNDESDGSSAGE